MNNKIQKLLKDIDNKNPLVNMEGLSSDGGFVGVEKAVYSLLYRIDSLLCANERLKKENEALRNEHFKDSELGKMKSELEKMRAEYRRGFPISAEEWERISKWEKEHLEKHHPQALEDPSAFGAIGGNFSFTFIPTSIGVVGYVQCSCGEQFYFTDDL